jgi:WD40 repeat protein
MSKTHLFSLFALKGHVYRVKRVRFLPLSLTASDDSHHDGPGGSAPALAFDGFISSSLASDPTAISDDVLLKLEEFHSSSLAMGLAQTVEFGPHPVRGRKLQVSLTSVMPPPLLISVSADGSIRIWHGKSCVLVLHGHADHVNDISISRDGRYFATSSLDSTVRIWDANTIRETVSLDRRSDEKRSSTTQAHDLNALKVLPHQSGAVFGVAFSPDSKLLISGDQSGMIRVWNVSDWSCSHTLEGHMSFVWRTVFSPDGALLATCSMDNVDPVIRVWDSTSWKCIHVLKTHTRGVSGLSFAPRSPTSVLASSSRDGRICLWDGVTGELIRTLNGHTGEVLDVTFGTMQGYKDCTVLASTSTDKTLRIWSPATGKCIKKLPGQSKNILSMAFSPGGSWLACGSADNTVRLWLPSPNVNLAVMDAQALFDWTTFHQSLPNFEVDPLENLVKQQLLAQQLSGSDGDSKSQELISAAAGYHAQTLSAAFCSLPAAVFDVLLTGYPRNQSTRNPTFTTEIKDRTRPATLVFHPGSSSPLILLREYKSVFSTKHAVYQYQLAPATRIVYSDPFIRDFGEAADEALDFAQQEDFAMLAQECSATIDIFGDNRTRIELSSGVGRVSCLCGWLAWQKLSKSHRLSALQTLLDDASTGALSNFNTGIILRAVCLAHVPIPPSKSASLRTALSGVRELYQAAIASNDADEAEKWLAQLNALQQGINALDSAEQDPDFVRSAHLRECKITLDALTSFARLLMEAEQHAQQDGQQLLEQQQFREAQAHQSAATEYKRWIDACGAARSMLDSHLDTEFLPSSSQMSNATGNHASSVGGPVDHASSQIHRDVLNGVASAAKMLYYLSPIVGRVFMAIHVISKNAAKCLANRDNASKLCRRCQAMEPLVQQVQAQLESNRALRSDTVALRGVYRHMRELQTVLESCSEIIRRFTVAGWIRRLVRASAIHKDFEKCDMSLTRCVAELSLACSLHFGSDLSKPSSYDRVELADIQRDVSAVRQDMKSLDERVQAEIDLLHDKLALVLQKKPTTYMSTMSAILEKLSLTPQDADELLQQTGELTQIGSGAFGSVYRCKLRGATVAVKVFSASSRQAFDDRSGARSSDLEAELRVLHKLNNVHLVRMFGVAQARNKHMLVMEYVPNGTLYHLLRDATNEFVEKNSALLTWNDDSKRSSPVVDKDNPLHTVRTMSAFLLTAADRYRIATQVAAAIVYLHANGCIHRDIKSLNILMDERLDVKLCDFGMARFHNNLDTMLTTAAGAGTPQYMAPEVWTHRGIEKSADTYAFGVLLFELFTGMLPWSNLSGRDIFKKMTQNADVTAEMKQLLSSGVALVHVGSVPNSILRIVYACVQRKAQDRPSMSEIAQRLATLESSF